MTEKKKNQQNSGAGTFILFWAIVLGILQAQLWSYSDTGRGVYDFVMYYLPNFMHRLWVAYVLHGIIAGLALGLAQKFAIQTLRPIRLQYYVWASIFTVVAIKSMDYLVMRFAYTAFGEIPFEISLALPFVTQILLLLVPWWFLRKEFKHAWLWLLLAIPNLALASSVSLYNFVPYLQALLGACVLLWLNHQSPVLGKSKAGLQTDERLLDMLPEEDEEEEESPLVSYQRKL